MRFAPFLDHLPPAFAWLALALSGYFGTGELALFALPLGLAALVEWKGWSLGHWRRRLEGGVAGLILVQALMGAGLLPTTATCLFFVAGLRLSLPRGPREQRQILLTGLLTLLAASILSTEISFLLVSAAWFASAMAALLQQTWEASALHHRGLPPPAPLSRVPLWLLGSGLIAVLVFLAVPRIASGFRPTLWALGRTALARSGLSDHLDLGQRGPIEPGTAVILRIQPTVPFEPLQRLEAETQLGLWRGLYLEGVEGQRWVAFAETPLRQVRARESLGTDPQRLNLDLLCAPTSLGVLPRPYGRIALQTASPVNLRPGMGASLRWSRALRVGIPASLGVVPGVPEREGTLGPTRRRLLLETGDATQAAREWSLQVAPEAGDPVELAHRLAGTLRGFRYTLDNPSGSAANPLQDFLRNSQAGHCEYFASALCFALRHRGVPARVVVGYRLGPWVPEGGYWVITEAEAHSWVEFLDERQGTWTVVDPTPPAPPSAWAGTGIGAVMQRWADALRFRWDRSVVRFSAEDQAAGLAWLRTQVEALPAWRPGGPRLRLLLLPALAVLAFWALRRFRSGMAGLSFPGRIPELAPLLRTLRRTHPPQPGETLRAWLLRLADLRPDRRSALVELAERAEAQAYGRRRDPSLQALARTESRHWR